MTMTLLKRELLLVWRRPAASANPVLFLLMVATVFAIASPDPNSLSQLAATLIWVAALLALLLTMDGLFSQDYQAGIIDQWRLSGNSLPILALIKVVSHWLMTGLPIVITATLVGLLFQLPSQSYVALCLSLCLGTFCLSLLGAVASALLVALPGQGILLSLLILPLAVPIVIFGTSCVAAASQGLAYSGQMALLAAILLVSLILAPLAIATALRIE